MALAEKIGDPIDGAVKNMVINHKAGLPLATFNASYGSGTKIAALGKQAMRVASETARTLVGTVAGAMGALFGFPPRITARSLLPDTLPNLRRWLRPSLLENRSTRLGVLSFPESLDSGHVYSPYRE